jgi:ParB family chromosome partitioning protein
LQSVVDVAQRLRDRRDTAKAIAALTAQLRAAGVVVIAEPPYDEKVIRPLRHLTHDGQPLTPDTHAACPGHAAYVKRSWGQEKAEAVYVCVHPRMHGHTDLTTRTAGAMTDEQKAERRTVVANNEAWRSPEKVRRAWLTDFLTRRTPPKGTAGFLAAVLLDQDCHPLSRACGNGHHRARELFRLGDLTDETDAPETRRGRRTPADLLDNATEARALVVTLGLVLAAHEDTWTTDPWRRPGPADARYLMFLMANGYTPAEVEQLVLGAPIAAPTNESDDDEVEVTDHGDNRHRPGADGPRPPLARPGARELPRPAIEADRGSSGRPCPEPAAVPRPADDGGVGAGRRGEGHDAAEPAAQRIPHQLPAQQTNRPVPRMAPRRSKRLEGFHIHGP